jgi:antitoxin (DNA-binding transcriptional repressor) of toxin-antitoxin stability system
VQIGVTKAGKILHQLLRRCATEPVVITRRGRPIARLQAFPRTRREMDAEILRRVAAFAPFDLNDLFGKEELPGK